MVTATKSTFTGRSVCGTALRIRTETDQRLGLVPLPRLGYRGKGWERRDLNPHAEAMGSDLSATTNSRSISAPTFGASTTVLIPPQSTMRRLGTAG